MGMAEPFTVRHDSPIAVGNGISAVAMLVGLRLAPKTEIRDPGATSLPRLAALTTRSIEGGVTAASKFQARAVNPEEVRAIRAAPLASGASVRVKADPLPAASGCSATRVGRSRLPVDNSTRSIRPLATVVPAGPLRRSPCPSAKANPAKNSGPIQVATGTSEAFSRLFPAANWPSLDAANAPASDAPNFRETVNVSAPGSYNSTFPSAEAARIAAPLGAATRTVSA